MRVRTGRYVRYGQELTPIQGCQSYPLLGVGDTPCKGYKNKNECSITINIGMEFEIDSRVQPIGKREGQTVYFAKLKTQQKLTNQMVIGRIVRETSLSEGDVKNALVSLSNIVCDALKLGMSVDLAELGSFRLTVSSKMMDSPEEVTVADALKTPKITFTPKQKMRDAANRVELSIDRSSVKASTGGGTTTNPDEDQTENPLG